MRQFYLSDPKVFELDLTLFEFKLYNYLCKNYDLKRLTPYVRMVDAADYFAVPLDTIKQSLNRLTYKSINYKPLITHKNFTYFDMPRYKQFLESIQFKKNYSGSGYKKTEMNVRRYKYGAYE
jgi:hypothetical protein|tara:strand:- start:1023 stop:1388 length:366 start_codon:yes stop_codon:yes gene_type:complete